MNEGRSIRRLAALTTIAVLGALSIQQAFASTDRAALDSARAYKGGKRIWLSGDATAVSTNSSSFVTLTTLPIQVPATQSGWSSRDSPKESLCSGTGGGWCSVRITLDGTEMLPASGNDDAFTAVGNDYASHAIERFATGVGAGNHTLVVEYCVVLGATTFRLDDWLLDAQYWRQP